MNRSELSRLLRTLWYLRPEQMLGQVRHRLRGGVEPVRAPGAAPRLRVAAPCTAFLPAPPHAGFDGVGCVQLLNREVRFREAIDWDYTGEGPLWAYHLHQLDWLRSPGVAPEARRRLMLDWVERHRTGIGWAPGPISLRALSWAKLLTSLPLEEVQADGSPQLRASLADQLATLERHRERHLLANHYLSNLIALVFGGLVLEGEASARWLAHESALRGQIDEQILGDGAHYERSPTYHSLLLEHLLDLLNVTRATNGVAPASLEPALRDAVARMLGALEVWTHPDGRIALFGDSAFGIAAAPEALRDYAARLGVEARAPRQAGVLDAAGFVRLAAGAFCLVASVAGPMPAYQPGHAHCDALAFELSVEGQRIVTDTGVSEYVSGPRREASRATRSHATVQVDGEEQAEVWAEHRVGGRPNVALVAVEPGLRAEAVCAGWNTPELLHRRAFELEAGILRIRDSFSGSERPLHFHLPLAPGLEPRLDGARLTLELASGRTLWVALPEAARWKLLPTPYFPEFGSSLERLALLGESSSKHSATWSFELR